MAPSDRDTTDMLRVIADLVREEAEFRREIHADLSAAVSRLEDVVLELRKAFTGDDYGNVGVLPRLDRVEDRQHSLRRDMDEMKEENDDRWLRLRWGAFGWAAGAGIVGGGAGTVLLRLLMGEG